MCEGASSSHPAVLPSELSSLMPEVGGEVSWDEVSTQFAGIGFDELATTPQNPIFHGEGDVFAHTRMVCDALLCVDAFWELADEDRQLMFLACLLHDIGKAKTTKFEDGRWTSPHHASAGASQVRTFLVRSWGMGGTPASIAARELVCWLVRWHMLPMRLIEYDDPFLSARRVAATGEFVRDATWHKLSLLAEADARGRIADDVIDCVEKVELSRVACDEAGCLSGYFPFPDAHVRRSYLKGMAVAPDQPLYDDTWGEVTLVCGLPGTGKDTWIARECAGIPMVSLDDIRLELGIAPTDAQGPVVQEARERARRHLRAHEPFVWNATNTTRLMRQRSIGLFEDYGARVRVVYLETSWKTLLSRNEGRAAKVPRHVIDRLLAKLEMPMPDEAQEVEWVCV